ncbi:hypothetical protein J6590_092326 [Homalodisca vitripennis]|nr:hypothetical protein J6590_092326 [Homalodisca vitripennis]
MVDACHRLRARDGTGKPPGIVVKMVRRLDAEALLQKRRVKRNLNTHDIGLTSAPAEVVYLNECLSPARRRLLHAARQVKKEKGYTYLWIRGGKILLRKDQGAKVKVVLSTADLNNFHCNEDYRSGGVVVYARSCYQCSVDMLTDVRSADCLQLTCHTDSVDFVLLAVYRLHSIPIAQFLIDIEHLIARCVGKNLIVTGDINCNILADDVTADAYLGLTLSGRMAQYGANKIFQHRAYGAVPRHYASP